MLPLEPDLETERLVARATPSPQSGELPHHVTLQPVADLLAEGLVLGSVSKVHGGRDLHAGTVWRRWMMTGGSPRIRWRRHRGGRLRPDVSKAGFGLPGVHHVAPVGNSPQVVDVVPGVAVPGRSGRIRTRKAKEESE